MPAPTEVAVMVIPAHLAIVAYLPLHRVKRTTVIYLRSLVVPCSGLWLVAGRPSSLGASRVAGSMVDLSLALPTVSLRSEAWL
jgi:hypothetical protein